MSFSALLLSLLLAPCFSQDDQISFEDFTQKYSKIYNSPQELQYRYEIFKKNAALLQDPPPIMVNGKPLLGSAAPKAYKLSLNEFADLSDLEFTNYYLLPKESLYKGKARTLEQTPVQKVTFSRHLQTSPNLPPKIDWKAQKVVTPVKSQSKCNSCYAFSTIGALEAYNLIQKKNEMILSEQEIIDCDTENEECTGGQPQAVLNYVIAKGIAMSKDYPYIAKKNPKCMADIGSASKKRRLQANVAAFIKKISFVNQIAHEKKPDFLNQGSSKGNDRDEKDSPYKVEYSSQASSQAKADAIDNSEKARLGFDIFGNNALPSQNPYAALYNYMNTYINPYYNPQMNNQVYFSNYPQFYPSSSFQNPNPFVVPPPPAPKPPVMPPTIFPTQPPRQVVVPPSSTPNPPPNPPQVIPPPTTVVPLPPLPVPTPPSKTRYSGLKAFREISPKALALIQALKGGPVIAAHYVPQSLKFYSQGVYTGEDCQPLDQITVNHAVLVVGYDLTAPIPFFLVKNSWGPMWGEEGFYKVAIGDLEGKGTCLIAGSEFNVVPTF